MPFFFKQWGEWVPRNQLTLKQQADVPDKIVVNDHPIQGDQAWRVGKAAAGRLLDGQAWSEFPLCASVPLREASTGSPSDREAP